MQFSIYPAARLVGLLSLRKAMIFRRLSLVVLVLAGSGATLSRADATFTYELSGADDTKAVKQVSIARFFARIDDPAEAKRFVLFQAGRFFPVYAVDEAQSSYRLLTPPEKPWMGPNTRAKLRAEGKLGNVDKQASAADAREETRQQTSDAQARVEDAVKVNPTEAAAEPTASEDSAGAEQAAAPAAPDATESDASADDSADKTSPAASAKPVGRLPPPTLKASKKMRTVAGIRCRVVHELLDGDPVKEHCMANSAALGVTKREVITLSRLFGKARKLEFDWLGVGTKDEEFVAVQSRDLSDNRVLELTSVSTKPLPAGYLRIPRSFKLVESDANKDDAVSATKVE